MSEIDKENGFRFFVGLFWGLLWGGVLWAAIIIFFVWLLTGCVKTPKAISLVCTNDPITGKSMCYELEEE